MQADMTSTSIQDNVQKFRELCEAHDLTYTYSDDGSVYRRGEAQYKEILEFSKSIPRNLAVQVWNQTIEKKLREYDWDDYKWKS